MPENTDWRDQHRVFLYLYKGNRLSNIVSTTLPEPLYEARINVLKTCIEKGYEIANYCEYYLTFYENEDDLENAPHPHDTDATPLTDSTKSYVNPYIICI